ncbi:MAG: 4-(cytidine 5'-diphospho)-2-C-methyl-D-erythritol kinase [Burkholderiales bacterium]
MTALPEVYPAPAKVNLFLHVTGRRPDGYHELQTIFRFIDCADTLRFEVRQDGQVRRVTGPSGVPVDEDLVVRAARLLQSRCGTDRGVDIHLDKRLPMGGGVGGGSSDAATTLIALNRLWGLGLRRAQLQTLGLALGADVPVFVFGRNAFAEGVGERLRAVELPAAWYVVLVPSVHVSTASVFGHPQLTRNSDPIKLAAFFSGTTRNDLETVVRRLHPEVDQALHWLSAFGDARMSGSGASVFCGFSSEAQALGVWNQRPRGISGFVARGLEEHPLLHLTAD